MGDEGQEQIYLSHVLAFVSDRRIRVGVLTHGIAEVDDARVAEVPRSLGMLFAAIASFLVAVMAFPSRVILERPGAFVNVIAFGMLVMGVLFGIYFVRSYLRTRHEIYLRVGGIDMLACTTDQEGIPFAIQQAIREAVRASREPSAPRIVTIPVPAHAYGHVPPLPTAPAHVHWGPAPQAWQPPPPPPFDPASLPKPLPWLAPVFVLAAFLALASFTASIASYFLPYVSSLRMGPILWSAGRLLGVVAFAAELGWIYRAWSAVPPWCRATATGRVVSPAEAAGFHFVPILNLGWVFTAHIGVCEATNAVLDAYVPNDGDARRRASPWLAYVSLTLASIPVLNVVTLPALLGAHMLRCDAAQLRMLDFLRAGPPAWPLQPPTERGGRHSLIRWRWVGPLTFLVLLVGGASVLGALAKRSMEAKVAAVAAESSAAIASLPPADPDPTAFLRPIAEGIAECFHADAEDLPDLAHCTRAREAIPREPRVHDYALEPDSARGAALRARKKGSPVVVAEVFLACQATCSVVDQMPPPGPPFAASHHSRPGTESRPWGQAFGMAFEGSSLRVFAGR